MRLNLPVFLVDSTRVTCILVSMNLKHQTQAIENQAAAIRQERKDLVLELTIHESIAFMKAWRRNPRVLSEAEYSALDTQDKVDYLVWEFRQRMY